MDNMQARSEQIVIYSLLMNPDSVHDIIGRLSSDMFKDLGHKLVYELSVELYLNSKSINATSIFREIQTSNHKNKTIARNNLIALISSGLPSNPSEVGDAMMFLATEDVRTEHVSIGEKIAMMAKSEEYDPVNVLSYMQEHVLNNKFKTLIKRKDRGINEILSDLDDNIAEAGVKGGINGIPTGFHDFDKLTSGMHPTNFIIIAGRPASGKTQFALGIVRNASIRDKKKGVFFSCEMTDTQLMKRIVCVDGGINGYSVKHGHLSSVELLAYRQSKERISKAPLKIFHGSFYIEDIISEIHKEKNANGIEYVIIDYLQKVKSRKTNGRNSEVEDVAGKLKDLANELQIPIIALAQLSRSVEHRSDKKPMLSDLRDSGAIEQDADIVAFLYRPAYYMDETERATNPMANDGYICVAKHRDGEVKDILMRFESDIPRWSNITDREGLTLITDDDDNEIKAGGMPRGFLFDDNEMPF